MRSQRDVGLSATTQVKVLSPEILLIARGQGFHILEASIAMRVQGERIVDVPGSKSVAGQPTFTLELGRAVLLPKEASSKPKKRGGRMAIRQSD